LKNLDRFKALVENPGALNQEGVFRAALLICTDVAARGIDIPNVRTVINYQMPVNAETYVHRCGRTARIGK